MTEEIRYIANLQKQEEFDNEVTELEDELKRLEQENKNLKKQIESQKGLITVGGKQQYEYLQKIDKLEQENKELKEMLSKEPKAMQAFQISYSGLKRDNKVLWGMIKNYKSALDTIQRMILCAWEQGKYLDGGLYDDLTNEFAKINEVLK